MAPPEFKGGSAASTARAAESTLPVGHEGSAHQAAPVETETGEHVAFEVDEDEGQARLLEQARDRRHRCLVSNGIVCDFEEHEPVAVCVHNGRVRMLLRLPLRVRFPAEPVAGATHAVVASVACTAIQSPASSFASQLMALTLHGGAPADDGSSGVPTRHLGVLERQNSAWRLIQGSSIRIPQPHLDVSAAPSFRSGPEVGVLAGIADLPLPP